MENKQKETANLLFVKNMGELISMADKSIEKGNYEVALVMLLNIETAFNEIMSGLEQHGIFTHDDMAVVNNYNTRTIANKREKIQNMVMIHFLESEKAALLFSKQLQKFREAYDDVLCSHGISHKS